MSAPSHTLLEAVHLVKAKLALLPPYDFRDHAPFDSALTGICNELVAAGAVIGKRPDGYSVRFCRIRATSTMGKKAALQNWVAAAYRRLDGEALK